MMSMKKITRFAAVAALCVGIAACGQKDPTPSGGDAGNGGVSGSFCDPTPSYTENVAACQPGANDYLPRVSASSTDTYPACISDDNVYHPINPSISTVARVAGFEQVASKLWEANKVPTAQDFIDARVIYAQDQGLDSRVQRREDIHYAAAAQPCSTAGVPEQNPDRCVGPAKLLPILNDAFARGSQGEAPLSNAARIEASLLWFLYVSSLSEVTSCTSKPQDCDSAWAYYSGGTARAEPVGFGRYVKALGPQTHDRAYDATLAVRCWRNLDNETGTATNLVLRDRARDQLDRATLRGVALIVRQRLSEVECATGDFKQARWTFVRTLVPFLDRAAAQKNPTAAATLRAQIAAESPEGADLAGMRAALDAVFDCP